MAGGLAIHRTSGSAGAGRGAGRGLEPWLRGASVALGDGHGRHVYGWTNSQGRFQLIAPDAAMTTLTVEAPGFAPDTQHVWLRPQACTIRGDAARVLSARVDVHGGLTGASGRIRPENMATITLSGSNLDLLPKQRYLKACCRPCACLPARQARSEPRSPFTSTAPRISTARLPPKDVIQAIRINANTTSAEFAELRTGRG